MGRIISSPSSLPPLATVGDYTTRVGVVSAAQVAKVSAALSDVSATVRRFTRQEITRRITVERFPLTADGIRLGQGPVHSVVSVKSVTGAPLAFTRTERNMVVTNPSGLQHVDIEYDHGYDSGTDPSDVLGQVAALVAVAAARTVGVDPLAAGVTSETIAGYAYSVGSVAAAGASGLLQSEKDTLRAMFGMTGAHQIFTSPVRYRR